MEGDNAPPARGAQRITQETHHVVETHCEGGRGGVERVSWVNVLEGVKRGGVDGSGGRESLKERGDGRGQGGEVVTAPDGLEYRSP